MDVPMPESIICRRDGAIVEVVLNRPQQRNAINDEMMEAIAAAFDRAEREFLTARASCWFARPDVPFPQAST